MHLIATLIAEPETRALDANSADDARAALDGMGGCVGAVDWLAPDTACEIPFDDIGLEEAHANLNAALDPAPIDIVVQKRGGRRKDLLIADMDATIVVGETLDELAAHAGLKDRIAEITARAMRGEIGFPGALRERVAMLKDLPVSALHDTLRDTRLMPGARALVRTMRSHGAYTVLVSGGFRFFTDEIATLVGFHANQANDLLIQNGRLTGGVAEPILDRDAKLAALKRIAREHDVPLSDSMAVGDGANDLPMIQAAGLGVAFHAKPVVEAEAPAVIRHGDLTALLYLQGYRADEFET
ncbi:MAG: phosphoserine phosphatase SerB [Alphaproteobacteria bacterium]